jgi:hypothetical protein
MEKDSIFELQKIDCNCNDCIFMIRDFETKQKWDNTELHENQKNASFRIHYGNCSKLNKEVSFIPNSISLNIEKKYKPIKTNKHE